MVKIAAVSFLGNTYAFWLLKQGTQSITLLHILRKDSRSQSHSASSSPFFYFNPIFLS